MFIAMLFQYTYGCNFSCVIIIYLYRAIDTSSAEFQGHLGGVYIGVFLNRKQATVFRFS